MALLRGGDRPARQITTQKGPSPVSRRGALCRILRFFPSYLPHSGAAKERRGVGARHALFPRLTDIGRPMSPVECHRLPVPRRRALPAKDDSPAFPAPRRSRPTVSPPPASRVRLLGPTPARLPTLRFPDPWTAAPLRTVPPSIWLVRGRHLSRARLAVVGLERRVLSLTPHVAFPFSGGRSRFRHLPLVRTLSCLPRSSPCQAPSVERPSVRDGRLPFHPSRLRHRADCAACSLSSFGRGILFPPHWLTVATIGL